MHTQFHLSMVYKRTCTSTLRTRIFTKKLTAEDLSGLRFALVRSKIVPPVILLLYQLISFAIWERRQRATTKRYITCVSSFTVYSTKESVAEKVLTYSGTGQTQPKGNAAKLNVPSLAITSAAVFLALYTGASASVPRSGAFVSPQPRPLKTNIAHMQNTSPTLVMTKQMHQRWCHVDIAMKAGG